MSSDKRYNKQRGNKSYIDKRAKQCKFRIETLCKKQKDSEGHFKICLEEFYHECPIISGQARLR